MKITKILFLKMIAVVALAFVGNLVLRATPVPSHKANKEVDLVSLLPSSDLVVKMNSKRFFNDSLPELLSFFPEQTSAVKAHLDELISKNGFDPRSFEQGVIGLNYRTGAGGRIDAVDFVVLARGSFDAATFLQASQTWMTNQMKGQCREETIDTRIVYICNPPLDLTKQTKSLETTSRNKPLTQKEVANKYKIDEVALTLLDSNTLAFAKPAQIRALLSANKTSPDPVLIDLLNRHSNAVISIAVNSSFYEKMMPLNLRQTTNLEVTQWRYGLASINLDKNGLALDLIGVAEREETARKLESSFVSMQSSMKQMFGQKSDEMSQALFRTIDNFKVKHQAGEIEIQGVIPKSDLEKIAKGYAAFLSSVITKGHLQPSGATTSLRPSAAKKKILTNR